MDMRHRVYYAVSLNRSSGCGFWWLSDYDSYGTVYDSNLKRLKGAVPSLKIRPLRHGTLSDRLFQMMVSCNWVEEVDLVAMLGQLKWTNYEKLDCE